MIGQMMEKVMLKEHTPRLTDQEIREKRGSWATIGKTADRERNIITSLNLQSAEQERHNLHLQSKYRQMEAEEVRYEVFDTDDADYLLVAYGSSARIAQKTIVLAREKGIKLGLLRPITLYPFPAKILKEMSKQLKGILSVEMSSGQMVEDVKLAVECKIRVEHFGRYGGMVHSPDEVMAAFEQIFIGG
jgi:2-oxoglutarate/2-oxoacid ferredoxin oxidoreductase subunit alpha